MFSWYWFFRIRTEYDFKIERTNESENTCDMKEMEFDVQPGVDNINFFIWQLQLHL